MSDKTAVKTPEPNSPVYEKSAPWIVHSLVSIGLLVVAFAVVMALFSTKPEANLWGDRPAPSVAVEIAPLTPQSYEVWVDSYGTATALTETLLVAEVNGRVVEVSSNIRTGSRFSKGDVLIELDNRNFKIEVDIAASAAADAKVLYLQELAQADFAAQEWNDIPESDAARKLALREPQVAAAEAALQAANARLERAKLDLSRTQITAPFDGQIMMQNVDIGQVVTPGQALAQIYSTDAVEVRLPIKVSDLAHLVLPEGDAVENQRPAVVLESDMGSQTYQWQAEIVRTEGAFDPNTRMLYVVAQVIEPFTSHESRPAVRLGQFMRAKVQGKYYNDVFVIPRRAVSQDFRVSIDENGVLRKRRVTPLWTDASAVVVANQDINERLQPGPLLSTTDRLILTPTANLPDGTRVRPLGEPQNSDRPIRRGAIIADASESDASKQAN